MALDKTKDREFPVTGMPNEEGTGYVDYVLWVDDGLPLGVVEAKRTKRDPRIGQQQAKLYADCLKRQSARRPLAEAKVNETIVERLYQTRRGLRGSDLSPRGVDGLFGSAQVDELVGALAVVRERAAA